MRLKLQIHIGLKHRMIDDIPPGLNLLRGRWFNPERS
jgi:hypothetical protein